MKSDFRVGRVLGINIYVDWSWLLIFVLIVWNLADVFARLHPDWGPMLGGGLAVVAACLFFASILAHELAHSLVARAQGIPVRRITLFIFGGVSNIQRDPETPRDEFVMAVLGPVTSLIIGMLLLMVSIQSAGLASGDVVSGAAQIMQRMNPWVTMLVWLGSVNIMLGLFNLIPGFPLDGGRVLRSILWALTGSLQRATRWAAWVGQGIAWLMIVSGIAMAFGASLPFLGSGFTNGLWLAFIGWFLNNASAQSYRRVVIQDILEDVPVMRMARTNPPTVSPGISISSLVHDHVMNSDDYAFPVLDGNGLAGLVTLDDVRKAPRDAWDAMTVQQVMTPVGELAVIGPAEDAAEALSKLTQRDVRQLPVLRDGELVGLLRRRDIVKWLQLRSQLG